MARILAVHHAQIGIPKGAEAQARAFYCGVLGLPEIPKPPALAGRGGFWLAVGALQVHVGVEEGVNRQASRAHLGYEVDDLAEMQRRLEAAAVAIDAGLPPLPGLSRLEARDPFGNRLEFLQPK